MNTLALVVSTTPLELPDAAAAPNALLDFLPVHAPLTWVRRGDGLIGWGEVTRIEGGGSRSGTDQFIDIESAWTALASAATVHDEVKVPGTGLVAFGSFAFDPASNAGGVLIVPEVIVGRRGDLAWVTRIAVVDRADPGSTSGASGASGTAESAGTEPSALAAHTNPRPLAPLTLADLTAHVSAIPSPGEVTYHQGSMTEEAWTDVVQDGISRIQAGALEKIVLARDIRARTTAPLDPRWMLSRLAHGYSGCWTFSVDGLVGATPELLVRCEKGLVISRVLAGTVRRTGDDDADMAHAAHLSHSSKDLEEHEYAVASVTRALEPFCSSSNVPEAPFVLHLPNVLHLATDVTGVLADTSTSSLTLAAALHPTAAVCGTPTDQARKLIREIEGLDRARYAAPVGWVGADGDGEWGLALRSAELSRTDPRELRLFAGCGIVTASVPADELAETEAKFEPMRFALGG